MNKTQLTREELIKISEEIGQRNEMCQVIETYMQGKDMSLGMCRNFYSSWDLIHELWDKVIQVIAETFADKYALYSFREKIKHSITKGTKEQAFISLYECILFINEIKTYQNQNQNKTYEEELAELEQEFKNKKLELAKKHAELNNPYKIGDIITDSSITIKIESWYTSVYFGTPILVYYGKKLKKNLTNFKDNSYETLYQSLQISKIN